MNYCQIAHAIIAIISLPHTVLKSKFITLLFSLTCVCVVLQHSVYSIFEKYSRIRNKQMFTNARAVSRVSYFLYFSCFSHMFYGKKVVLVFL